jgi:hypothetical protein
MWYCHDEAVLLRVGLDVFSQLHPESSTELSSTMPNSHFHQASENGLAVTPWEPQNTVSSTFPADGVTLHFLVGGELGCFHCIEARFDLGCQ